MNESKINDPNQNYGSIDNPPPPPQSNTTPLISNNKTQPNNQGMSSIGVADISTLTDEDDETLFAGLKDKDDDMEDHTIMTNTSQSLMMPHSLALSPDTTLKSINTNERSILLPNITNVNGAKKAESNVDEYDYYNTLSTMSTNFTASKRTSLLHNILCSKTSCLIIFLMIIFTMTLNYSSNLWDSKSKNINVDDGLDGTGIYFGNYDVLEKSLPFKAIERKAYGDDVGSIIDFDLLDNNLLSSPGTNNDYTMKQKRLKAPLPTQSFWTNLLLKDTSSKYPIITYPYACKYYSLFIFMHG